MFNSIQKKILSLLSLILFLTLVFVVYFVNSNQKKAIISETDKYIYTNIESIVISLRNSMLDGMGPTVVRTIDELKHIKDYTAIDIFRTNGRLAFSDDTTIKLVNQHQGIYRFKPTERLRDTRTEEQRGKDKIHIDRALNAKFPLRIVYEDMREIEYYYPIKNLTDCMLCHGSDHTVRGVVRIRVSYADTHKKIQAMIPVLVMFFSGIGFSLLAILFFTMKKIIISPVLEIGEAARQVGEGNFKVTVQIKGKDEIGKLGSKFNSMAGTIGKLVNEKTRHINELDMLNKLASAISKTLSVEELANTTLSEVLSLEHLGLEKKGAIFIYDEKKKLLQLAASHNFGEEQKIGCSNVLDGECLCGIVAEQKEMLLSVSNIEDKRHSKVYSDAKEHGHIILPFKSRGKMLGVLCLYLPTNIKPTDGDIQLYESIADIIAVSMQNALNHRQVAMLARSLESSSDVIVMTDLEDRITYVTPETARQLGYPPEELIGQPAAIIQSPNNPTGLGEEIFRETMKGGWSGEVLNIRKDGSEYPVLLTTSPVKDADGKIIALIGIARDITVYKQMVGAENAKQVAEAANRAKSDFLANMSHELRTPLNSIIGFSEVLRDGMAGEVTGEQKDYLKDIWESGQHLLRLINDILDLSKVEAGKMELELSEFNLKELIEGSLVMFKEKAMKHRIKLSADVPDDTGNIIADAMKIKQVIFNLLSNAFKFIQDGGSVRITARRTEAEKIRTSEDEKKTATSQLPSFPTSDRDFIEITVEDTGIGISPEDQEKLFQPFQQLETSYTKRYAGTGLGLNLCKKFIELHGGKIWVESEIEKGSRFVFIIPIKQ